MKTNHYMHLIQWLNITMILLISDSGQVPLTNIRKKVFGSSGLSRQRSVGCKHYWHIIGD